MNSNDDSTHILDTQLQSKFEDSLNNEIWNNEQTKLKMNLSKFKHNSKTTDGSNDGIKIRRSKVKRVRQTKSKKSNKKLNGLKTSMSDMVRQKYLSNKLEYFSGDQRKIDEFVKGVTQWCEQVESTRESRSDLYLKDEWLDVLKKIRLKFPNLPSKSKTSLSSIIRRVEEFGNDSDDNSSIWIRASTNPEEPLTNDDLMILYDFSDKGADDATFVSNDSITEQQKSEADYVLTLSQVLLPQVADTQLGDVISDSEEDIGFLTPKVNGSITMPDITSIHEHRETNQNDLKSTDEPIEIRSIPSSPSGAPLSASIETNKNNDRSVSVSRIKFLGDISLEEIQDPSVSINKVKVSQHCSHLENEIEDSQDEFADEMDSILEIIKIDHHNDPEVYHSGMYKPLRPDCPVINTADVDFSGRSTRDDLLSAESTESKHEMTTSQLRIYIKEVGFQPPRSKNAMVKLISEMEKIVEGIFSSNCLPPSSRMREGIFRVLTATLKNDTYWFAKTITFEPININHLHGWLCSDDIGINIDIYILQTFCDEMGINYTTN